MSETREFDLGDVLTVATGLMLSRRHMDGLYDILNWMTDDNLFTHQLPRALRVCRPAMLAQHPELAEVTVPEITPQTCIPWLEEQEARFGQTLLVARMERGTWEYASGNVLVAFRLTDDDAIDAARAPKPEA